MISKIIEATNGPQNWGKFLILRFTYAEWMIRSKVSDSPRPLLAQIGWTPKHIWVLDLQTGEGAFFLPGGNAHVDLNKHKVWVCPLFEPFLTWLYTQNLTHLMLLPAHVDLPDAAFEWAGYRRPGSEAER